MDEPFHYDKYPPDVQLFSCRETGSRSTGARTQAFPPLALPDGWANGLANRQPVDDHGNDLKHSPYPSKVVRSDRIHAVFTGKLGLGDLHADKDEIDDQNDRGDVHQPLHIAALPGE